MVKRVLDMVEGIGNAKLSKIWPQEVNRIRLRLGV